MVYSRWNSNICLSERRNNFVSPWTDLKSSPFYKYKKLFEIICRPSNGQPGDVLILTKPLGGQMAMDATLWQLNQTERYKTLRSEFCDDEIKETFEIAVKSMTYLNKNGTGFPNISFL